MVTIWERTPIEKTKMLMQRMGKKKGRNRKPQKKVNFEQYNMLQECIPVGCIPSAAVAVGGGCLPGGSAQGGGGGCDQRCLTGGCLPSACWDTHTPRGQNS